jgi:hypothetical protein
MVWRLGIHLAARGIVCWVVSGAVQRAMPRARQAVSLLGLGLAARTAVMLVAPPLLRWGLRASIGDFVRTWVTAPFWCVRDGWEAYREAGQRRFLRTSGRRKAP